MTDRKLIRAPAGARPSRAPAIIRTKEAPPEITHAESNWLARRVESRTPLSLHLRDGEVLEGVLDWHDRGCLRLSLADGSHRIVQKLAISYLHETA